MNARTKKISAKAWLVPNGLLLLSAVPILAGGFRIFELTSGAESTEANARFFASLLPSHGCHRHS